MRNVAAVRRPAAGRALHARLFPPYEPRQPRGDEVDGQSHNPPWLDMALTLLFGHRIESDYLVGPVGMMTTRRGVARLRGNLTAIMQMVDLANLHDVPIAAVHLGRNPPRSGALPAACSRASLPPGGQPAFPLPAGASRPAGPLLRELHDVAILERFLPDFARARGLLQFNQYHKYTVDEHCIRAVEFAEKLARRSGAGGPRLSRAEGQAPAASGAC